MATSDCYPSNYWSHWQTATGAHVQRSEPEPEQSDEYDFLTFLGTVQAWQIEILPIAWETGREPIGTGGTSKIQQAPVNLETSLACKTYHKRNQTEQRVFRTLVNEIIVLNQGFVRRQKNIAQLQGICWDISAEDDKPWPVLVFEMSSWGDLYRFATHEGRNMTSEERLGLCVDMGIAILEMHANDIVHGDIKPENVLVFLDKSGKTTVKIIDFGFSSRYMNDDERLALPISDPWNAPEIDGRLSPGWTPSQAVKADFYSFGMLCLWLLFEPFFLAATRLDRAEALSILRRMKEDLPMHAQSLLRSHSTFSHDINAALDDFFSSSLSRDPQDRHECLLTFLKKMDARRADKHSIVLLDFGDQPGLGTPRQPHLTIQDTADQLYNTDYRVRTHIANCLINRRSTSKALAMQEALCYHIGFGVKRDETKVREVLARCRGKMKTLNHLVSALSWPYATRGAFATSRLREAGYEISEDRTDLYAEQGKLDEAGARLTQETSDLAEVCGPDHSLVVNSKQTLAEVYSNQRRWDEAEKLQAEVIKYLEAQPGADVADILNAKSNRAYMLGQSGHHEEAEAVFRQVLAAAEAQLGEEDHITVSSMANLAAMIQKQDRIEEAGPLLARAMKIRENRLGPDHPSTLALKAGQAMFLLAAERLEESEVLARQVWEAWKTRLGDTHPDTLRAMYNLNVVWTCQGRDGYSLERLEECARTHLGPLEAADTISQWKE